MSTGRTNREAESGSRHGWKVLQLAFATLGPHRHEPEAKLMQAPCSGFDIELHGMAFCIAIATVRAHML